jgi:hypothetical protein
MAQQSPALLEALARIEQETAEGWQPELPQRGVGAKQADIIYDNPGKYVAALAALQAYKNITPENLLRDPKLGGPGGIGRRLQRAGAITTASPLGANQAPSAARVIPGTGGKHLPGMARSLGRLLTKLPIPGPAGLVAKGLQGALIAAPFLLDMLASSTTDSPYEAQKRGLHDPEGLLGLGRAGVEGAFGAAFGKPHRVIRKGYQGARRIFGKGKPAESIFGQGGPPNTGKPSTDADTPPKDVRRPTGRKKSASDAEEQAYQLSEEQTMYGTREGQQSFDFDKVSRRGKPRPFTPPVRHNVSAEFKKTKQVFDAEVPYNPQGVTIPGTKIKGYTVPSKDIDGTLRHPAIQNRPAGGAVNEKVIYGRLRDLMARNEDNDFIASEMLTLLGGTGTGTPQSRLNTVLRYMPDDLQGFYWGRFKAIQAAVRKAAATAKQGGTGD